MTFQIENIEEARQREGIDDVVLRDEIGRLKAGDQVHLSVSIDGLNFETLAVRVTSFKGSVLRGKLLENPRSSRLGTLAAGAAMIFTAAQVHSIVDGKPAIDEFSRDRPLSPDASIPDETSDSPGFRFTRPVAARAWPSRSALRPGQKKPVSARKPPRRSLRVEGNETRRYVPVPAELADELHRYLQSHSVWSSPPHPHLTDVDCLELDRNTDIERVQALLKAWR
jgi:hypothetical protein